jgi:simple sugar transport system substrate-binding protein
MSRFRVAVGVLLSVLVGIAALAAAGCGSSANTSSTSGGGSNATAGSGGQSHSSAGKKMSVVMVTHATAGDPFWNAVKNGAQDAAKDYGVNLTWSAPQSSNIVEMARLLDEAIARKPDGIAVTIPDPVALGPGIKKAIAQGIPVISLNSGAETFSGLGITTHVGMDEGPVGVRAGKLMAAAGVTNALCVNMEQGNKTLELRCKGFKEGMAASGGKVKEIVTNLSDPTGSARTIQAALSRDSSINGILTLGQLAFDPTVKALQALGKLGKIKLGTYHGGGAVDLQQVASGNAMFAIDQEQYLQGYLPVEFMAQRVRLGISPDGVIPTGPNFVTKQDATQAVALAKQGLR